MTGVSAVFAALRGRFQALRPWLGSNAGQVQAVVLAGLTATALVTGARSLGALQGLELALYDQMVRLRPDQSPDDRLLVVGITETDIQSRQEWPISDRTLAELLAVLERHQPQAIGLDLFRDVPIEPGHGQLSAQLAASERLTAVCKMSSADNPGVPPPPGLAAEQISFSDVVVDAGGTLRRSLLIASPPPFDGALPVEHGCNTPKTQLLALSFQLALGYLAEQGITPVQQADGTLELGPAVLTRLTPSSGGYRNSDAGGYQILLNYRAETSPVPVVSLGEVLSGQVPAAQIRDRIVLIGYTTPQAKDDFYTPYSGGRRDSQKMPGVVVHAQATSQLLSAALDGRPLIWSWPAKADVLWILVWGLGGAAFAWRVRRPLWFACGSLVLIGSLYGISYGLFLQGGWIPLVPAVGSLVLAASGAVLIDRFNRSSYGQAVYRQVKTLLRLEIEIDSQKVERQVKEITQSDYFDELKQRAQALRQRPEAPAQRPPADSIAAGSEPDSEAYLQQIKEQAQPLKPAELPARPPEDQPEP
jgi:adenylate cyclase